METRADEFGGVRKRLSGVSSCELRGSWQTSQTCSNSGRVQRCCAVIKGNKHLFTNALPLENRLATAAAVLGLVKLEGDAEKIHV